MFWFCFCDVLGSYGFVGAGTNNNASGFGALVVGGEGNTAAGSRSSIVGGYVHLSLCLDENFFCCSCSCSLSLSLSLPLSFSLFNISLR